MPSFESSDFIHFWAGTIQDIVEVGHAGGEKVAEWSPGQDVHLDFTLEFAGTTASDLTEGAFAKLAELHLKEIEAIKVHLGERWWESGASILIDPKDPVVMLSIRGGEHARIEGLRAILLDHLRRGRRWRGWSYWYIGVGVCVGAGALNFFTVVLPPAMQTKAMDGIRIGEALSYTSLAILFGGFALIRFLLVPSLELLP
ncbi:MAG: hypothetical protein WBA31_10780, partial [Candidatus Dormiibacterota bacterium]